MICYENRCLLIGGGQTPGAGTGVGAMTLFELGQPRWLDGAYMEVGRDFI